MENISLEEYGLEDLAKKQSLMQQYFENMPVKMLGLGIRVVLVIILFVIGYWLIRLIRRIIKKALERSKVDNSSIHFIDSCVKIVLFLLLIFLLAGSFGVDAASIVALIGSAAITIGLAFQGSLSNFAGGVLILVCKPFVVGDYILEKSTNVEGTVVQISLFYTRIRTRDYRMISIPNGALANTTVIDASALSERRIDLSIPVSYSTKIEDARKVILKVLEDEKILAHDKQVFVDSLENSDILLGVEFYVRTGDYLEMKRKILEEIIAAFEGAGITIPFEQIDVHVI